MTDLNGKIVLGENQYGKAENRVVRIYRDSPRHEIHDINVSTSMRGDFTAAHLVGDQTSVLPTAPRNKLRTPTPRRKACSPSRTTE